jgi:hypothetical protein
MSIFTKSFVAAILLCGMVLFKPVNADTPTTAPSGEIRITSTDGTNVVMSSSKSSDSTTTITIKDGNTTSIKIASAKAETDIKMEGGGTITVAAGSVKIEGGKTTISMSGDTTLDVDGTPVATNRPVDPNAPVVIPFELLSSGHIAIMAKVNGHGPYRFVFDTGAPTLVMSERVAKDAGVLPKNFSKPFFTPLGNLGNFNIKTLEVGGGKQLDIETNVWNHPTVELLAKTDGPLEGLIGFPFFAHYDLAINYKAKTLTLTPCAYKPLDTNKLMQDAMAGQSVAKQPVITEPLGIKFDKPAGDSASGVKITDVYKRSPAETAGIKVGDRLLTLDGRWTDSPKDCAAAAAALTKPGEYPLTVFRDGKLVDLKITVSPGI